MQEKNSSSEKPFLVLLTLQYPFGQGETFIENEIPELVHRFNLVIVPCQRPLKPLSRELPNSVSVVPLEPDMQMTSYRLLAQNLKSFVGTFKTILGSSKKTTAFNRRSVKELFSVTLFQFRYFRFFNELENKFRPALYYSYWMNENALVLAMLQQRGIIDQFVSRVHGFDLYDEQSPYKFQPFRKFVSQYAKTIFPISNFGYQYLLDKGLDKNLLKVSRLGTQDFGLAPIPHSQQIFTLVTCANALPVKRLEILAEVLDAIPFAVHWHYFGDGPILEALKSKKFGPHVKTDFHGRATNERIMEFYQENAVHGVVLLSESEGLPVSLMEAISFGIPVAATDVGGVKEIVQKETGVLLPANANVETFATLIAQLAEEEYQNANYRAEVHRFWQQHFQASVNFGRFSDYLLKIARDNFAD